MPTTRSLSLAWHAALTVRFPTLSQASPYASSKTSVSIATSTGSLIRAIWACPKMRARREPTAKLYPSSDVLKLVQ